MSQTRTSKTIKFEFIQPDISFCTLICKLLQDSPRIDSCIWAFEVNDTYTNDVICDQVITFQENLSECSTPRPEKIPYLLVTQTKLHTDNSSGQDADMVIDGVCDNELLDIIKQEFCNACEQIKAWILRFDLD